MIHIPLRMCFSIADRSNVSAQSYHAALVTLSVFLFPNLDVNDCLVAAIRPG